jgi:hypothetical protein
VNPFNIQLKCFFSSENILSIVGLIILFLQSVHFPSSDILIICISNLLYFPSESFSPIIFYILVYFLCVLRYTCPWIVANSEKFFSCFQFSFKIPDYFLIFKEYPYMVLLLSFVSSCCHTFLMTYLK